jgi:putative salt-induced outer membrane protein
MLVCFQNWLWWKKPTFGTYPYFLFYQIISFIYNVGKMHALLEITRGKRMKFSKISLIGAIAALQLSVSAGSVFAQEERAYDASISLGYVGTSGNTKTKTFNTEGLYALRTTNWTHNIKFQALGSSDGDTTEAERYYLEDKSDYNLNDDAYLFGKGTYTVDRFSGFDSQFSASAGYGRYLFRQDRLNIQGYGGVGYRENKVRGTENIGETIISLGESLEWDISDTSRLVQNFSSEIGEDITVTKFEVGLESNIVGNIVTKIAFEARNISEVPVGTKKTDTLTSISLVYTF